MIHVAKLSLLGDKAWFGLVYLSFCCIVYCGFLWGLMAFSFNCRLWFRSLESKIRTWCGSFRNIKRSFYNWSMNPLKGRGEMACFGVAYILYMLKLDTKDAELSPFCAFGLTSDVGFLCMWNQQRTGAACWSNATDSCCHTWRARGNRTC